MSHTQHTVVDAIFRSISHDEIVTVVVDPDETMMQCFRRLTKDSDSAWTCDYVAVSPTLWEVWGTTAQDEEWRVHLRSADHVVY